MSELTAIAEFVGFIFFLFSFYGRPYIFKNKTLRVIKANWTTKRGRYYTVCQRHSQLARRMYLLIAVIDDMTSYTDSLFAVSMSTIRWIRRRTVLIVNSFNVEIERLSVPNVPAFTPTVSSFNENASCVSSFVECTHDSAVATCMTVSCGDWSCSYDALFLIGRSISWNYLDVVNKCRKLIGSCRVLLHCRGMHEYTAYDTMLYSVWQWRRAVLQFRCRYKSLVEVQRDRIVWQCPEICCRLNTWFDPVFLF